MANEYKVEIDYIEHIQMLGWKFVELKNYEDVKANFRIKSENPRLFYIRDESA